MVYFKLCSHIHILVQTKLKGRKEGKCFIYGYMASDMVKDHSDSERGNPLPPHTRVLVTPVMEHWLE